MIPKIIHQIWVGDKPIPVDYVRYMQNILHDHSESKHCFWDDITINVFLNNYIKQLHPNWFDLYYAFTTPVEKSDYLRLLLLNTFGGVYMDMDIECVKPIDTLLGVGAFVAKEDSVKYCNAVMGSIPNHSFIQLQLEKIPEMLTKKPGWGVGLLNETLRRNPHEAVVYPTDYFYPFNWDEKDPEKMVPTHNTYLIHHWGKTWWKNPDK